MFLELSRGHFNFHFSRDPDLSRKPSELQGKRIRFLKRTKRMGNQPPELCLEHAWHRVRLIWLVVELFLSLVYDFIGFPPCLPPGRAL